MYDNKNKAGSNLQIIQVILRMWGGVVRKWCRWIGASQTLIQQFWDGTLGFYIFNKLPGDTDAAGWWLVHKK